MSATLSLGVIGVGPAATLEFLARLQAYTPAQEARDHLRVLLDLNPKLPDLDTPGSGAGPALAEMAGALRGAGAQVLAIPSDAAHAHTSLIERASGLAIIDMIGGAAKAAAQSGARRVGVLGGRGALRLYREYLAAQAMGLVTLDSEAQAEFVSALQRARAGERTDELARTLTACAKALVAEGAETVIAGAPEIAPLIDTAAVKAEVIEPADLLAQRAAAVCLGLEPAPSAAG